MALDEPHIKVSKENSFDKILKTNFNLITLKKFLTSTLLTVFINNIN